MTKIRNKTAYPLKNPPTVDDYIIGSNDARTDKQTRNFRIGDILDLVPEVVVEQNNIGRLLSFEFEGKITSQIIAIAINNLPAFTIGQYDDVEFKAIHYTDDVGDVIVTVRLIDVGKGNYGTDGTQITFANLQIRSITPITASDLLSLPSTILVDYGDLEEQTLVEWINEQDPAITIQPQASGYTVFQGTIDGIETSYWWIGSGGNYGDGGETAVDADLQLVESEVPSSFQNLQSVLDVGAYAEKVGDAMTIAISVDPESSMDIAAYNDEGESSSFEIQPLSIGINNSLSGSRFATISTTNGDIELLRAHDGSSTIVTTETPIANTNWKVPAKTEGDYLFASEQYVDDAINAALTAFATANGLIPPA